MQIAMHEMRLLYAETIAEYNVSPLAVEDKHYCEPNEEKLAELVECAKYLPSKNATFLDVGTGMGIAPRFFRKIGCRTITVDNPLSGGRGMENAIAADIKGIACDILDKSLPLEDESVDCVLFGDVIEHLVHSPKYALKEFQRVLKPGGVCVATTPNALRASVRIKVFLGYSNWPHITDYFDAGYHGGHHHEYTIEEFKAVFAMSGFEVVKFILGGSVTSVSVGALSDLQSRSRPGSGRPSSTHPLIALGKIPVFVLERVFPSLRPQMLLVAQKV